MVAFPRLGGVKAPRPAVQGVLAALPGLSLMAAGSVHPHSLTEDSARLWWTLHVPGMLAFPLVGVALAALYRHRFPRRDDPLAWLVVLAAFGYAIFYNALDILSGVGAGWVTSRLPSGAERPDEVRSIFAIGGPLGEIGSWCLLVAAVLVTVDLVRRWGPAGAPAVLLVPGAWAVHVDHIFWPLGALGMGLVGVVTGYLVLVLARREDPVAGRATRSADGTRLSSL